MPDSPPATPDLVLRGRVISPGIDIPDGLVAITADRIGWVGALADAPLAQWPTPQRFGTTLLPGLIDLHCHGGGGGSFPSGDLSDSRPAARHHLERGTTGLVASLVTAPERSMIDALQTAADLVDAGLLLGVHIEGPFLAPSRCGAQDPAFMCAPDQRLLGRLLDAGRGHVVSMTYAPELAGADAVAEQLVANGVVPSLGHTDADEATAAAALSFVAAHARNGLGSVTHLFNGMRPFHHRDPGPVTASLRAAARHEVVVELVADGVHLADATVAAVLELVGPGSVALVTDAMAAAGQPDGRYRLGSRTVEVVAGVARVSGAYGDTGALDPAALVVGTDAPGALAGGTSSLVEVVRRCVQVGGVDLAVAVEAATSTPARLLGVDHDRGALAVDLRADVLAVDDELRPVAVWCGGRRVQHRPLSGG